MLTRNQQTFIQGMIDSDGTLDGQILAYQRAFKNCKGKKSAQTCSYRLLNNVEVKAAIQDGLAMKAKIIAEARREELIRQAKEDLLSVEEVDAAICRIIRRQTKNIIKRPVYNPLRKDEFGRSKPGFEIITVEQDPSTTDIVAAADRYYKRHGHYAPKKYMDVDPDQVLVPGEDDEGQASEGGAE